MNGIRLRGLRTAAASVAIALAAVAAAAPDATVVLRGGRPPVMATSVVAGLRGLEARGLEARGPEAGGGSVRPTSGAGSIVLPWDLIASVEGAGAGPGLDEYLAIGTDLWRARIRVERGDAPLARPLFERHAERYLRGDGPTSALVAEGLLRCAIAEGDLRGAVGPWLASLRIQSTGEASRFDGLPRILDESTGLLPTLAPFVPARLRPDLAEQFGAARGGDERGVAPDVASRLARLVVASDPSRDSATPLPAPGAPAARDAAPAVRALAAIEAVLLAGDGRALAKALADFDREFADPPAFLGAWRLAAAGAFAAREARAETGDRRARRLEDAALSLLAVPASGLDASGLVEAYAFEEAAALLREAGDATSAGQIDALLKERVQASPRTAASGR